MNQTKKFRGNVNLARRASGIVEKLQYKIQYLVEVRQNPPKNQIGIVDKNPDYYYLYVKPLRGKMILLQSTFYKTLSPTANKIYVPHDLNESDEEIQGNVNLARRALSILEK